MLKLPQVKNIQITFLLVVVTLLLGTIVFHNIENWTFLDSLYFSVITLTTIGFGDISPVTPLGKLFTIFYVFLGIGIVLTLVNLIAKREVENQIEKKLEQRHRHHLELEMLKAKEKK